MNTETLSEIRSKLTHIEAMVALGCTLDEACGIVDVTARTYRRWKEVIEFSRVSEPEFTTRIADMAEVLPELEVEFGRTFVSAGTVLFNRGDLADDMYIVSSGKVWIAELNSMVGEGEIVGEIGIFSEARRRTASAVTVDDCELVRIPREKALELGARRPSVGLSITHVIAERLAQNLADAQATVARLHVAGIY
jgi:CRP-like cAMP-binding protein